MFLCPLLLAESRLLEMAVTGGAFWILGLLVAPVFSTAHDRSMTAACSRNLRTAEAALAAYAQDYDGVLPRACAWSDGIQHYEREPDWFRCPAAPRSHSGYAYNASLDEFRTVYIAMPGSTPQVFDAVAAAWNQFGGPERLDFRHLSREKAMVGFADGHVKSSSPNDARGLTWQVGVRAAR